MYYTENHHENVQYMYHTIQNIHSTQIEVHNLNDSLTQTKFEVKVSEFTVMYLDIPHHIKKNIVYITKKSIYIQCNMIIDSHLVHFQFHDILDNIER